MSGKSRGFPEDPLENPLEIGMSDADLEALLAGQSPPEEAASADVDEYEPGQRIDGLVIDLQAGDVLVEIDSKTHGLIEESEFVEHDDLPAVGTRISANFVRFDASRELVILSMTVEEGIKMVVSGGIVTPEAVA